MADLRRFGNTSNLVRFILKNSSTGLGLTGLTLSSSGLIISTICDDEATATAYTQAGSTIESITTLGVFAAPTSTKCRFKEVDATNHKGLYEFQFADTRFAITNARRMVISVTGAASLLDADYEIQLTQLDPYDAVRGGMTALPNAVAAATGGLPTLGAAIPFATAGASGGLTIAGANAATTFASFTVTGGATFTGGITASITGNLTGSVNSVTTAIALPTNPPAGFINAAAIATSALNGKGDWNTVVPPSTGAIATAVMSDVSDTIGVDAVAIKAKTDNLPASPAAVGSAMTLTSAYDAAKTAASASQIPANFTAATFASAGVFSTGALANAPTGSGGGGGDVNVITWLGAAVNPLQSGRVDSYLGAVGTGLGTPLPIDANLVQINGADITMSSGALDANLVSVNATVFAGANVPIDKTGHSLAATGLDAITTTEPTGPTSGYNFRQLLRWLVMNFNRVNRTPTTLTVKTNAGGTSTTQTGL